MSQSDEGRRVNLEGVDIESLLPFTRLFSSFRMAMQPGKLVLAFVMILLVYGGGRSLDGVFLGLGSGVGGVVYPGEISQYTRLDADEFEVWLDGRPKWTRDQLVRNLRWVGDLEGGTEAIADGPDPFGEAIKQIDAHFLAKHEGLKANANPDLDEGVLGERLASVRRDRMQKVATILDLEPRGIFATALGYKLDCLDRLLHGVLSFDLGLDGWQAGQGGGRGIDRDSVLGALRDLTVTLPGWLLRVHPWYWSCYLVMVLIVYPIFCGALSRMAAMNASLNRSIGMGEALCFALSKYVSFLMTPLLPAVIVGLALLMLWLGGVVFFNLMLLDIVGGLLFFVAIGVGLFATMTLILMGVGGGMMYPALAVEGTDAFDVVSRVYNYVLFRPWRWLFYSLVALVNGVAIYLVLWAIVNLSLTITQAAVSSGVGEASIGGVDRFDLIMPVDWSGTLLEPGVDETMWLSWTGSVAAFFVRSWAYVLLAMLWAFVISFYFCAHTWIYLLLRRVSDGTEFDDIAAKPESVN